MHDQSGACVGGPSQLEAVNAADQEAQEAEQAAAKSVDELAAATHDYNRQGQKEREAEAILRLTMDAAPEDSSKKEKENERGRKKKMLHYIPNANSGTYTEEFVREHWSDEHEET